MRKTRNKSKSQQEHFFLNNRFNDFDEFANTIRAWDLDFFQLVPGKFWAELLQFDVNTIQILHARFNRHLEHRGSSPPGLWTFALLTEESSSLVWRGREVSNDTLLIHHPGSEVDAVSKSGFDVHSISLSESMLTHAARTLGLVDFPDLLGDKDSTIVSSLKLSEFRRYVRFLISEVQENPYVRQDDFDLGLTYRLLNCLEFSPNINDQSSCRKKDRALRQIKDYIKEHPHEPLTVQDLCNLSGVSRSTIEHAFLEHFGVSPKQYLKAFRLNGARRELRRAYSSAARISDVANRWGFWHMGQFAADYKKLFEVLPSEYWQNK
jgi:AraC-like DNA-binding protein